MELEEYRIMYEAEDTHWWYRGLRGVMFALLGLDQASSRQPQILDAGCGTGGMLDLYRSWPDAEATGADLSPEALRFSHERGHNRLVGADLTRLPFRSNSFDVVSALDVIEHV
ncbi:MAG TPA: class I SAM-dependent methyltransferase, partial [Chloroflexia bacterium]|nr:class I SAM-dependent methyltransferase [Chloroflexia bacterium]